VEGSIVKAGNFFLAIAVAAVIAGCGGGTDSSPGAAGTPQAASAALHAPAGALAAISAESAANQLMDFAEGQFPGVFPEHQASLSDVPPFLYRHYSNGAYLGVVVTPNDFFVLNGVYTVGGPLGGLIYRGQLDAFITPVDPGTGNKNLVVTVNTLGTISTINVGLVPVPASEGEFCSGLAADTTFAQIGASGGGTLTVNSCSFAANTGTIQATLFIATGYDIFTVPVSITYAFQ